MLELIRNSNGVLENFVFIFVIISVSQLCAVKAHVFRAKFVTVFSDVDISQCKPSV
jgi:hypothetical protein